MYIQYITYHWICNTTFTVVFHKYPPPRKKKKKSNRTKATLHVPTQYTHSVNTQPQAHQLKPAITNSIHKHAQEVLFKEGIGHFLHQIPDFSFPLFFLSFFFLLHRKCDHSAPRSNFLLRCTSHFSRWALLRKSLQKEIDCSFLFSCR